MCLISLKLRRYTPYGYIFMLSPKEKLYCSNVESSPRSGFELEMFLSQLRKITSTLENFIKNLYTQCSSQLIPEVSLLMIQYFLKSHFKLSFHHNNGTTEYKLYLFDQRNQLHGQCFLWLSNQIPLLVCGSAQEGCIRFITFTRFLLHV